MLNVRQLLLLALKLRYKLTVWVLLVLVWKLVKV
jgi:hypothetical protein